MKKPTLTASERWERDRTRKQKAEAQLELAARAEKESRLALQAEIDGTARCELTRREREVLGFVDLNLQNKEIADKLKISERTVKFYVSSLLAKFGVTSRQDLRAR